jgi:hypothetical protein
MSAQSAEAFAIYVRAVLDGQKARTDLELATILWMAASERRGRAGEAIEAAKTAYLAACELDEVAMPAREARAYLSG